MPSQSINKTLKRWSILMHRWSGVYLDSHVILIIGISIVLLLQLLMFLIFNSETIYCKLPNLRHYHQTCQEMKEHNKYEELPTIYVVTPTYQRYVQKPELVRLSHTLMLVPKLHWIIVEDSEWSTSMVSKFIYRLKNQFDFQTITLLHASTPERFKLKRGEPGWKYPKGVWQRNRALSWLRENHRELDSNGVVYFADDDNTYDLELFQEMRYTRRVSVWPVGLVGGLLVEKPNVEKQHDSFEIKSFNSMWERKRPFPLDMAGFAVSLHELLSNAEASFSENVKVGYVESHFLNQLVNSWDQLEPKADKCSKVLVWHTQTRAPQLHEERKLARPSDSDIL